MRTQSLNYAAAGGDKAFDTITPQMVGRITALVEYTGLDEADAVIKVQQSVDGDTWNFLKDSDGDDISYALATGTTKALHINIVDFYAPFFRFYFDAGNVTTGTITSFKFIA